MKKTTTASPEITGNHQPDGKADYALTIANHVQAAVHHAAAAKYHTEAAALYKAGNLEKAAHSAMIAYGHHVIAGDFISDDAKHHAQLLKQTNYGH